MTIIKGTTKKGIAMVNSAMNYEGFRLFDVYEKASQAKHNAWDYCWSLYCKETGACNFHICSHNTFNFSVSWDIIDTETGEVLGIRIKTAQNSYYIAL